jgi:hypothetical protein
MKTSIAYKCHCMPAQASFDVDARRPSEDVVAWMERVVRPALGKDHAKRSPICQSTAVEYLKIPVPEDGRRIGDARERLN